MALSAILAQLKTDISTAWSLTASDSIYDAEPDLETPTPYAVIAMRDPQIGPQTATHDEAQLEFVIIGRFADDASASRLEQKLARFDQLRARLTLNPGYTTSGYMPVVSGARFSRQSAEEEPEDTATVTVGVLFSVRVALARGS